MIAIMVGLLAISVVSGANANNRTERSNIEPTKNFSRRSLSEKLNVSLRSEDVKAPRAEEAFNKTVRCDEHKETRSEEEINKANVSTRSSHDHASNKTARAEEELKNRTSRSVAEVLPKPIPPKRSIEIEDRSVKVDEIKSFNKTVRGDDHKKTHTKEIKKANVTSRSSHDHASNKTIRAEEELKNRTRRSVAELKNNKRGNVLSKPTLQKRSSHDHALNKTKRSMEEPKKIDRSYEMHDRSFEDNEKKIDKPKIEREDEARMLKSENATIDRAERAFINNNNVGSGFGGGIAINNNNVFWLS